MQEVTFFLDFISPYTWLALTQAEAFAAENAIRWQLRPIVYGAVLEARGLLGPVETPEKRRYTFHDIARSAERAGVRFVGPPAHPFRSLDALRLMTLFRDDPRALVLARGLADAAWSEGRNLTDTKVLEDVLRASRPEGAGLDGLGPAPGAHARSLPDRLAAPAVKAALRDQTAQALAAGVFGVPTFLWNGELFWGHDRMSHLADRLCGRLGDPGPAAEVALARPIGVVRGGAGRSGP